MLLLILLLTATLTNACNLEFHFTKQGELYKFGSPSYPEEDHGPKRCIYNFVGIKNSRIFLDCEVLDIETTNQCRRARLSIKKEKGKADRRCGTALEPYVSEGTTLTIKFLLRQRSKGKFHCTVQTVEHLDIEERSTIRTKPCSCGISLGRRIVGGKEARKGAYPWLAALRNKNDDLVFCGGAVIDKQWILTAAHCTVNLDNPVTDIEVLLLEHDLLTDEETDIVTTVSEVIPHPDYNANSEEHDICLIKLSKPVTETAVHPVCLPFRFRDSSFVSKQILIAGWGLLTEGGKQANTLQFVTLPVIPYQKCRETYHSFIRPTNLCTYKAGKDACQGDSGGPAIYNDKGRFFLVAITSWGNGCAKLEYPGVYTRVTSYLDWVQNTTKAEFCEK